jgi:hypothetical protein
MDTYQKNASAELSVWQKDGSPSSVFNKLSKKFKSKLILDTGENTFGYNSRY